MSGNTKKFKTKNGLSTQNVELVSTTTTFELQANLNTVGFSSNNTTLLNLNTDETGVIFSVNDASQTPFIEVESDGDIRLAEVQGKVLVGFLESADANTKLQVEGGISTDTISLDSLTANGSQGTSGQVLTSNGSTVYWSNVDIAATFTDLTDTPASYANSEGYVVTVNQTANGLVFSNDLQTQLNQQQTLVNLILMGS